MTVYFTLWCNKCKKKIGRYEERFRATIQVGKCGVCHTPLEERETT